MKILVAIKRVPDANTQVRPLADGNGVNVANTKMVLNPFCEIAVEEAIRLKERGIANEVVVVSIGASVVQEQLRSALALGADRAIHILSDIPLEPLGKAKVLADVVKQENPGLVLLGKQSIDGDHNQIGQMLAALCKYPLATFASQIELKGNEIWVTRELDVGLQTLALCLPAVVTTDLRLNEPRYPTMPNIMKARQKPLAIIPIAELAVDVEPRLQVLGYQAPAERKPGIKVGSVAELVEKLRQEAKVI